MSGRKLNLDGRCFDHLTVICDSGQRKNGKVLWKCQCDCGNIDYIRTNDLTSGKRSMCKECSHKKRILDLTNKKFGKWTVIENTFKMGVHSSYLWKCQCECGTIREIPATILNTGKTKSCGCANKKDLKGQRFGKLTVLQENPIRGRDRGIRWDCLCDCGNICTVHSRELINGDTQTCGCTKYSKGESLLAQTLNLMNIKYVKEKTFKDCINPQTNACLRFDFYLPEYNCCIEYDGEQHFSSTNKWHDKNLSMRDSLKDQYCKNHSIKLIRIPYFDLDKIDEQYIKEKINEA